MTTPYFSIIVPCYNQAQFLGDCVYSIQSQSCEDWELIIVNDGSTDTTREVAERYGSRDNRIKVINKINGGLSSARNAGIDAAKGIVLHFLDADDFQLPNCLEHVKARFKIAPRADLVRVGYHYIDETKSRVLHRVVPRDKHSLIPSIFTRNIGPCHSIFIKRTSAQILGGFDESLKSAEDWDFWIRAVKAGATLKSIPDVLVAYRYVGNSMSRDGFRLYAAQKEVIERGHKKDNRILIESALNFDYAIDVREGIKKQMLMCLGVSVMQGKIEESVNLYRQEEQIYKWKILPCEFAHMYSYLSFRYWNTPAEIKRILEEYYPKFDSFFVALGLSEHERATALKIIFAIPMRIRNQNRYGRWLGRLINYIVVSK